MESGAEGMFSKEDEVVTRQPYGNVWLDHLLIIHFPQGNLDIFVVQKRSLPQASNQPAGFSSYVIRQRIFLRVRHFGNKTDKGCTAKEYNL